METGLGERNADHLELTGSTRLGQLAAGDAGLALEERKFARVVKVLGLVLRFALADRDGLCLLFELVQRLDRRHHLAVIGHRLVAEAMRAPAAGSCRLLTGTLASTLRKVTGTTPPSFSSTMPKLPGNLASGGKAPVRLEREAGGILQSTASVVLDARGQLDSEFGVLREGLLEDNVACLVPPLAFAIRQLPANACRRARQAVPWPAA